MRLKVWFVILLFFSFRNGWAVCEEVVNRAPAGFDFAEALVAIQGRKDEWTPLTKALDLQWVQRLGRWQIFQLSKPFDFFPQCAPKKMSIQYQGATVTASFYPVLKNSQGQLAVVVPEIVVKASRMERIPQLEKQYALKRELVFPTAQLIFYQVAESVDLDTLLHDLSNEIGVEAVKPVLRRQRYHLR